MAKYLINVTETYRVDTEEEAVQLIEDAKKDNQYVVAKYGKVHKDKKAKGEVVEEWERVTITKAINDEKDPFSTVKVFYGLNNPTEEVTF